MSHVYTSAVKGYTGVCKYACSLKKHIVLSILPLHTIMTVIYLLKSLDLVNKFKYHMQPHRRANKHNIIYIVSILVYNDKNIID